MKTNCHNLPGICEVRYIHVTDLQPYLVERADAGAPISVEINKSQVINIYGNPTCTSESEEANNGRQETATLEFMTLSKVPVAGVAFLVRQASGQWFLIGCSERVPVVSLNYNTGEMAGEASVTRVTVTFTAFKALLPVAV